MLEFAPLTNVNHRDLRVVDNAANKFAAKQHVLRIQATEVGRAGTDFPVLFSRSPSDNRWALSAITSLEAETNLFVKDGRWTAAFRPMSLDTHPLYLVNAPGTEEGFAIGIAENSDDFSRESGERLFDDEGNPSEYLSGVTKRLEEGLQEEMRSQAFVQTIDEIGMLRAIDMHVQYEDGTVKTITGLMVPDEEKLRNLTAEQLLELNQKGYLVPIHASLASTFQLAALVKRHNDAGLQRVREVTISLSQDAAAEEPAG